MEVVLLVAFLIALPKAVSLATKTPSGEKKVRINWEERIAVSAHQFGVENTLAINDLISGDYKQHSIFYKISGSNPSVSPED